MRIETPPKTFSCTIIPLEFRIFTMARSGEYFDPPRPQVIIFAVPRNIARLTLGHGISRKIISLSWPSPGQCEFHIFTMAGSGEHFDPPRPQVLQSFVLAHAGTVRFVYLRDGLRSQR